MKIVGIDPGLSGAISLHDGRDLIEVRDMPVVAHRVNGAELADLLTEWAPHIVILEQVNAFPKSAAKTAFTFGRAFGTVEGVIDSCVLPLDTLTSPVWKRKLGISNDKDESRALASRLWPAHRASFMLAKHDGRAEAALIVEAWRRLRGAHLESVSA